jgi:hypothetical protein
MDALSATRLFVLSRAAKIEATQCAFPPRRLQIPSLMGIWVYGLGNEHRLQTKEKG